MSRGERSGHLPSPPTVLVGREGDAVAVSARLVAGRSRLLTVAGPAGVGKSRLALEVAATVDADRFPDGVELIALDDGTAPDQIVHVIAERLDVAIPDGADPVAALVAAVGRRRLLLVLDDVDPLLGDSTLTDLVAGLLAVAPDGPALLVTCRRRLGLQGEHVHALAPLPVEPYEGDDAPACRLFADRAAAVVPGFALTPETAATVAAICRRCDGIPLAIELAAARLAHLTPGDLLARLARPLDVLTGGPRDRPARYRSMREAIAWTYDRLPREQQALARAVAVFPESFSLSAAEAVGSQLTTLDALSALVDEHLLERRAGAEGETRFALLWTTRAFGLQQLAERGEAESAHRALVAHVVTSTEAHQPDLRSDDPAQALDRLEADHATIRAALDWAFSSGLAPEGLRICTAVYGFWTHRGHVEEAARWLVRGLAAAGDEPTVERANAELLLGHSEPDVVRSTAAYERALATYRAIGNDRNTAGALLSLGVAIGQSGAYGRAVTLLREAHALFREMGAEADLAQVEYYLGRALRSAGQLDDAQQALESSRARCERLGDSVGVVYALLALGMLGRQRGKLTEAAVVLEWCARRAEALGLLPVLIDAHTALAAVALAGGERPRAEALSQEVVRRFVGGFWDELGPVPALDGFALATFPRSPEVAIQVLAAVATWRRAMNYPRDPVEEQQVVRALRDARQGLSAPRYERAWALGLLDASLRATIDLVAHHEGQAAANVPHFFEVSTTDRTAIATLTRQERTVLCHVVGGATNQEVADTLSISSRTVAKHVENILAKLEVGNRTAAAAMAVLGGLCRADVAA